MSIGYLIHNAPFFFQSYFIVVRGLDPMVHIYCNLSSCWGPTMASINDNSYLYKTVYHVPHRLDNINIIKKAVLKDNDTPGSDDPGPVQVPTKWRHRTGRRTPTGEDGLLLMPGFLWGSRHWVQTLQGFSEKSVLVSLFFLSFKLTHIFMVLLMTSFSTVINSSLIGQWWLPVLCSMSH